MSKSDDDDVQRFSTGVEKLGEMLRIRKSAREKKKLTKVCYRGITRGGNFIFGAVMARVPPQMDEEGKEDLRQRMIDYISNVDGVVKYAGDRVIALTFITEIEMKKLLEEQGDDDD